MRTGKEKGSTMFYCGNRSNFLFYFLKQILQRFLLVFFRRIFRFNFYRISFFPCYSESWCACCGFLSYSSIILKPSVCLIQDGFKRLSFSPDIAFNLVPCSFDIIPYLNIFSPVFNFKKNRCSSKPVILYSSEFSGVWLWLLQLPAQYFRQEHPDMIFIIIVKAVFPADRQISR